MKENKKVDFMIIGAMKSGTTSLANDLACHPEVFFSVNKEPGYFAEVTSWREKIDSYHGLFSGGDDGQLWGEASTQYTMRPEYPGTHERLHDYNPSLRLIYIMRDPVDRIVSNFSHNYVRKRVSANIINEIGSNPSYLTRSRYYYQLEPFIEQFGMGQIHLIIFEDYVRNPNANLIRLADFLGIDSEFYQTYVAERKNASAGRKILADGGLGRIFAPLKKHRHRLPDFLVQAGLSLFGNEVRDIPEFPATLKHELYKSLEDDREKLEQLLGYSVADWRNYPATVS